MVIGGMFFVFHAVMLLVISFFVLIGASKVDSLGLRTFGRMLAFALWVLAVYLIAFSIYGGYLQRVSLHKEGRICYHSIQRRKF